MDFNHQPEDKLENLPHFEKFHDYAWDNDDYWGKKMPYARLKRWILGQEGKHIDSVIHKFVKLNWLLREYRTLENLRRHIEFDTFMEDGRVCYYPKYMGYWHKKAPYCFVEDGASDTTYIHPITRLVTIYHAPTRESWKKRHQAEMDAKVRILGDYHQLYKLDGIWYEVKAEKIDRNRVYWKGYSGYGVDLKPDDIILETKSGFMPSFKVILKHQLNSKELKKFGLKNG